MGLTYVFLAAAGAVVVALISAFAMERATAKGEEEILDRDCFRARLTWLGDLVALSTVATTSVVSIIQQSRLGQQKLALMIALWVAASGSSLFAIASAGWGLRPNYLNRYPESFYQRLSKDRWAGSQRARWLTPGVIICVVLSTTVALTTLAVKSA